MAVFKINKKKFLISWITCSNEERQFIDKWVNCVTCEILVSVRKKIRVGKKIIGTKGTGYSWFEIRWSGKTSLRWWFLKIPKNEASGHTTTWKRVQTGGAGLCLIHPSSLTDRSHHHFVVGFYPNNTLCCGSSVLKILTLFFSSISSSICYLIKGVIFINYPLSYISPS